MARWSVYFHGLIRADSSGMFSPRVALLSVYSALRPEAVMEDGLDLEKSGRRYFWRTASVRNCSFVELPGTPNCCSRSAVALAVTWGLHCVNVLCV